ncbi:hypothetical protein LTR36_005833 [Oleoguttula mirabilis]|uniref:Uncharacterized protein n=1 Tax=Oleoguttula mirabilis TaxID=1507867 RepID=A0AAV9JDH2_9PEZI|nr:hypothetical protein LTR36_005833 [Oleoguttula mirabilis]
MPFDMFGRHYITPLPCLGLRPRFIGWLGFAPGWQDYMDWMGEDDYSMWRTWQNDISELRLSRVERRARLLRILRREQRGMDFGQLEERADRMLGMENGIGADEYGHVINRTETTTSTTTTIVTPQQRMEVANLMIQSAKASANPNLSTAQLKGVVDNIQAGRADDLVREQLQKTQSGQVQQVQQSQPAPRPVQQPAQYGGYQQTAQNYQQSVQTAQPQPVYSPAPQQRQPVYTPAPPQQPPVYAPPQPQPQPMTPMMPMPSTPAPVQQQPMVQQGSYAGQQSYSQTSTTTTTTSSTNTGYAGQSQVMLSTYQQQPPAPNYGQQQPPHQAPQQLRYQAPLQIGPGQGTPLVTSYNQQGQGYQPQMAMAHAGQAAPYAQIPQTYSPQTPAPQQMVPAGQASGYEVMSDYPQQQQQPYQYDQYGQPMDPQGYQPAPESQHYIGYDQSQQPAYSQEMVPSSSAVKPHKEKKHKESSSSKKEKK